MLQLARGQFYGNTHFKRSVKLLTLTDTVYTHDFVDWHYHEMPYFTFLLQGGLTEGSKNGRKNLQAGNILFHHWNECHYNQKPAGISRGFHLEIDPEFLKTYDVSLHCLQGSHTLQNPLLKILFYRLLAATKMSGSFNEMVIESLVLEIISGSNNEFLTDERHIPKWVHQVKEILIENYNIPLSLNEIADILNIHPVHLSRSFSKYFHCTLGEYVRRLKIEKAMPDIVAGNTSFTDIAYECGFADQSHFIRVFKAYLKMNPSLYKKLQKKQMLI